MRPAALLALLPLLWISPVRADDSSNPATPGGATAARPRIGAWGFDLDGRDLSVAPGQDFNRHASGTYYRKTQIPADRISIGGFMTLIEEAERQVVAIVEAEAAAVQATGDDALVGQLYRSFMDEPRVEALDDAPLQRDLDRVRAAATPQMHARLMGEAHGGMGGSFFVSEVMADMKDPSRNVLYVALGGLGLPDRDFYLAQAFEPVRVAYRAYLESLLVSAGWPDARQAAADVWALELGIARVHWTRTQRRQRQHVYNPMTLPELEAFAPEFPWRDWAEGAGVAHLERVVVMEKDAFPMLARIFAETAPDVLKAWQAAHVTDQASPFLSERFVDRHFEFRGKLFMGLTANKPRNVRGARLVDQHVGDPLGRLYVARHFPPASKAMMERLVADLRTAMRGRIARLEWMSAQTRERALEKMRRFGVKIGYPNRWRDYSGLRLDPHDLYGNVVAAGRFNRAWEVARLERPVDPDHWDMNPQQVNAYYHPERNEIVFPAAILQPPFFDPNADSAVNYGAIGAVIGHEITHGFDDQGRKSDGAGVLRDWWTPEDAAEFEKRAQALSDQYSAIEVLPGAHVDGDQTLGENIADLGGVLLAVDAYRLSLAGASPPVLDGVTAEQRLFYAWAQLWRSIMREAALRQGLSTDTHSPGTVRARAPLRNVDSWYEAFEVTPADTDYLPPERRVRIW